jgi:hypothetical protein
MTLLLLQMARILTPELAAFYEAYYMAKGIKLVKGQLAKEFKGDGKVGLAANCLHLACVQLFSNAVRTVQLSSNPVLESHKMQMDLVVTCLIEPYLNRYSTRISYAGAVCLICALELVNCHCTDSSGSAQLWLQHVCPVLCLVTVHPCLLTLGARGCWLLSLFCQSCDGLCVTYVCCRCPVLC